MPQLGQAQTGSLRSTPKQLSMTTSDKHALIFKNYGNNHNAPFVWSTTATIATGETEVVTASGIKFYDMDLASYANTVVTPTSDPGGYYYVSNDTVNNVVKLYASTAVTTSGVVYNVQFMLGNSIDVSTLSTRGTGAPAQSYP